MVRDEDGFTTVRRGGVDPHHAHKVLEFAKDMLATVRSGDRREDKAMCTAARNGVKFAAYAYRKRMRGVPFPVHAA